MKLLLVLALVVLVGDFATATEKPASESTKVSCSAFAGIKIRQSGSGTCRARATAKCASIATAQDAFKEAYDSWFSEGGDPCDAATIELAAEACARAAASVYTEAMASVQCKLHGRSKGFACGYSVSEGSAFAVAMAKAIAQAAVDVTSIDGDAFCYSDVEVQSAAFAEAAASAQSEACVKGSGKSDDFNSALVESIAEALASAFVTATAKTCSKSGAAAAKAECEGQTLADVRAEIKEKATPGPGSKTRAKAGETFDCDENMAPCCARSHKSIFCSCTSCGGTWIRRGKYGPGKARIWKKRGGSETCRCLEKVVV